MLDFALERKHYGVAKLIIAKGTGNPVLATPALAGDLLLVRGAKHLFAIAE